MKKFHIKFLPQIILSIFVFCNIANAQVSNKRKALVVLSSAHKLQLMGPEVKAIPVGIFLVELAKMLQDFEDDYEFTFATPDGEAPQLDINGFDLNFYVQGSSAPFKNLGSSLRNTRRVPSKTIGRSIGLSPEDDIQKFRKKRQVEFFRREGEVLTAIKHLGKLSVSEPLPNTHPEAREFRKVLQYSLAKAPLKKYHSFTDLINSHRDISDPFKFDDFDFVFIPGGHAPMVDLGHNPELGEIMNVFHEQGKIVTAVCHGPVSLTSAFYRLDENFEVYMPENSVFKNTKVTTVSNLEENIMLNIGYIRVPHEEKPTELEYFVESDLSKSSLKVKKGGALFGFQFLPGSPKVVYDTKSRFLTANGPQSMDLVTARLKRLVDPLVNPDLYKPVYR